MRLWGKEPLCIAGGNAGVVHTFENSMTVLKLEIELSLLFSNSALAFIWREQKNICTFIFPAAFFTITQDMEAVGCKSINDDIFEWYPDIIELIE